MSRNQIPDTITPSLAISPEGKPELVLPVGPSATRFASVRRLAHAVIQIPKSTARPLLSSTLHAVISPALTGGAIRTLQCIFLMAKAGIPHAPAHAIFTISHRLSPSLKSHNPSTLRLYDPRSFVWHRHWQPLMRGTYLYLRLRDQIPLLAPLSSQ